MTGRYRKKPVVIEARQFRTNNEANGSPHMDELIAWCGDKARHDGTSIYIETLEGTHRAEVGDWIIKGIKGEFYPCKPDIFAATYESADEEATPRGPSTRRSRLRDRRGAD